ncbi:acyltransferase [Flavobacterium aquicola]
MNLITDKITIHKGAFIGARAFIMPGITIGENAIVGAGSLVTKNVEETAVVAGNPAKIINYNKHQSIINKQINSYLEKK